LETKDPETRKMTYLGVSTRVAKPERQADFMRFWTRCVDYMRRNPEMFRKVKSLKLCTQVFGGVSGAYVEMVEFESLTDQETLEKRLLQNEEAKRLFQEFNQFKDTTTHMTNLLKLVM
jgi:hypothetical protein